ncbi:MAG: nucleotide exchange factor GrpE [Patescibacteria group bacterium]|nr:nucleotide exchange factor GrpE [Patescibacteria group bacterium]MDE1966167.1 nucleotide exchange factor GrpE [Patescibacteria group bacterium]
MSETGDEEFEFEPENNEPPRGSDPEKRIAKLTSELDACKTEKQEYLDGWQRAKADYVNALKRFDEEKKAERMRGVIKAAEALLPAFDALERAKEHGGLPEGFAGIVRQLEGGFSSLGLEPLGEAGEAFNPALHDALGQDPAPSAGADDTVSAVLERGWKLGDSVIRPAKVRVYHFAGHA